MRNGEPRFEPPSFEPPLLEDGMQRAPSSASLWGDMFGLGGFMKVITDPNLITNAAVMMKAMAEGAAASQRIERKLDALLLSIADGARDGASPLARMDHDIPSWPAALPVADGTDGTGRLAIAGRVADRGIGDASPDDSDAGGPPVGGGR